MDEPPCSVLCCLCESFLMGVSGRVFLLVPAHQRSPGKRAVKQLCVFAKGMVGRMQALRRSPSATRKTNDSHRRQGPLRAGSSSPPAIGRYLLPASPQQRTCSSSSMQCRMRQRGRRTDARQLHRPCSAYYTGSDSVAESVGDWCCIV